LFFREYIIFKNKGTNEVPVQHEKGLNDFEYFGDTPFLDAHKETYGNYEDFKRKWAGFSGDPKENKLSFLYHFIGPSYLDLVYMIFFFILSDSKPEIIILMSLW